MSVSVLSVSIKIFLALADTICYNFSLNESVQAFYSVNVAAFVGDYTSCGTVSLEFPLQFHSNFFSETHGSRRFSDLAVW
jgi:hypothetical protein